MINMMNNNDNYGPSDWFNDMIANLDGGYSEYKYMRDLFFEDEFEKALQKHFRYNKMSDYLNDFDTIVELIDYLWEQALELEDYEFCGVLKLRALWAHWKSTGIDEAWDATYAGDMNYESDFLNL